MRFAIFFLLIFSNQCFSQISCNNWLKLNGSPDGVRIGDLDVAGDKITVEAVFNRTIPYSPSFAYAGDIVSKHIDPTDCNYLLRPRHAEITTSNGFFATTPACDFQLNKTYHVAMVYDGATLKFYRNGFLLSQINATGNLITNNWIAKIGETAGFPYNTSTTSLVGFINEVRIWNVARTQQQLKSTMNSSLISPATQTGLLAYYTFDNLINKQGNPAWNGVINGASTINSTNPSCPLMTDSCNVNSVVVTPGFNTPDTVCVNTSVTINNTSTGASSYYWNFCAASANSTPTGLNLGNPGGKLSNPVFIDYAFYNGNYYGFLTNYSPAQLIRLDFGNSLLNTPTSVNLGNFGGVIPSGYGAEGIQIVYNENKWYALIVAGYTPTGFPPRILKIEFGANLANPAPTATNWGNLGNMLQPIDLHVFKEGNNWYGFTVNAENNSITRFNFTNSFSNTPTAVNLGNLGDLAYPTGIYAINDNNFWRVFIVNAGDNMRIGTLSSLTRLDFGSSLLNTPTAVNLGNPGNMLAHPRDLTILKSCNEIIGFAVNGNANSNNIVKLNFNNNLASTPVISSLGNVGSLDFPHSISKLFRVNNDIYGFVPNVTNNTLTRLKFSGCNNSSILSSVLQNPPSVTYNTPGTYNINLNVDDGLATADAYCRQVIVVPELPYKPLQNFAICEGDSVKVGGRPGMTAYSWSTGAVSDSINIFIPGTYWVESSRFGCRNRDSFMVSLKPKPIVSLPGDTSVCNSLLFTFPLQAGGSNSYQWFPTAGLSNATISNPDLVVNITATYTVTVNPGANGCPVTKSINLIALPKPNVLSNADTFLCGTGNLQLQATGAQQYQWSPSTGLSNPSVSNPVAAINSAITYIVEGTAANGCKAKDTTVVNLYSKPVIAVSRDTALCQGVLFPISAGGAQQYQWWPLAGLNASNIQTPVANIDTTIVYTVIGTAANGCKDTNSVRLTALPQPILAKSVDTTICQSGTASLFASGAQQYLWSPSTGLNNPASANPVAAPSSTTMYYLKGIGNNGCETKDSVLVTVRQKPVFSVAPIIGSVCNSKSIQLSGFGGDSYLWQPAASLTNPNISNPIASPTATTTYSVLIKDTFCKLDSTFNIPVTLNPNPVVKATKSSYNGSR